MGRLHGTLIGADVESQPLGSRRAAAVVGHARDRFSAVDGGRTGGQPVVVARRVNEGGGGNGEVRTARRLRWKRRAEQQEVPHVQHGVLRGRSPEDASHLTADGDVIEASVLGTGSHVDDVSRLSGLQALLDGAERRSRSAMTDTSTSDVPLGSEQGRRRQA